VVHSKLIHKLTTFGIDGKLLAWLQAFLFNRYQCVLLENSCSGWTPVISGVPQGSVLGPILFILFINDISQIASGQIVTKLFADDLKLYISIKNIQDNVCLQNVLAHLSIWCSQWQLTVNLSKSCVIHLHKDNNKHTYFLDGKPVPVVDTICDLGITISSDCSFDQHIGSIIGKAHSRVGLLFRAFVSRDLKFLKLAYTTYVRPILEYATCVWSPYLLKHINAIEKVQCRFTKRIPSLKSMSYSERLAAVGLETFQARRLRFDLVMYFKILNNLTPWPPEQYLR